MSARSLLVLVVGIITTLFVFANWGLITQPADLSFLVGTLHAPLGLVLLGLMVLIVLMFIAIIAYLQSTVLLESRKHTKEMNVQRELADKAEASRFTELKAWLDAEIERLHTRLGTDHAAAVAELQQAQQALARHVEEQSNSLAASMAHMEDHIRSSNRNA